MSQVQIAKYCAALAHAAQMYGEGDSYVNHVKRVAERVSRAGGTEAQIAAAWLHDVLEDTEWTAQALQDAGVAAPVIRIVEGLTRKRVGSVKEFYHSEYITRCAADPEMRLVKRCDVEENYSSLPGNKTPEEAAGLKRRYQRALEMLEG